MIAPTLSFDWLTRLAEVARTAARLILAGQQIRESKMAGGDVLSPSGGESVWNAIQSRRHLRRGRETDLGVAKRLESSVRGDKMLINETEWPPTVVGRSHMGNPSL
jgi:hypothetical protein